MNNLSDASAWRSIAILSKSETGTRPDRSLPLLERTLDRPKMPIAILPVVGFDQQLIVSLVDRDGDFHRFKLIGVIERDHLTAVQINDGPVI